MCTSYFIDNTKDDLYMASITRAVSSSGLAHRMREKLGRPITTYGRVKPGDIVPVIAPDINEDDIGEIIQFALQRHPHVRGVHFQPLSYFGRCELSNPVKSIVKGCPLNARFF